MTTESTEYGIDKEARLKLQPHEAAQALAEGLTYLRKRLDLSGHKIAEILRVAPNTVNSWMSRGEVPIQGPGLSPTVEVVIHLLAIHRGLETMFDKPELQRKWLTTMHPAFRSTPLQVMSESTEGLISIRQYLDFIRSRGA